MPRRHPFPALRISLALTFSATSAHASYDAPNFDRRPVDPDAISLSARERGELATALATVANFSDAAGIDDDLREKALGVALTLAPLHPEARASHARLSGGKSPAPLPGDQSLAQLSSQLWKLAERLSARDAEPEDRRLAPMLMEISLLIRSGNAPEDRRLAYQQASEVAPVNWNRFLTLQPKEHPSNARAIALFRPVSPEPDPIASPSTPARPTAPAPPMVKIDDSPEPTTPTPPAAPPVSEIKITESAIAYLALDRATRTAVGGTASFKVRDPTEDEAGLFGLFLEAGNGESFEMRLTYDRDGPVISNTNHAERLIRRVHRRWPDRRLGEFTFQGPATLPPPGTVDLSLPALFMLSSAFSGESINDAFAPAREFLLAGQVNRRGEIEFSPAIPYPDLARAAAALPLPPRALFLPDPEARAERELLDAAIAGEPELLLSPQLILYDSVEALQPILFGDTPATLTDAIEEFAAVQDLRETMEVGVIARNEYVQQRLRAVVEKWPGHLSARLLLALGARPADMALPLNASLTAISQAIQPVDDAFTAQIEGTGGTLLNESATIIETTEQALTGLRQKIDPQARETLAAAERTLEAYQAYFSLSNRDSSLGQQRLRELLEKIADYQQELLKSRGSEAGED